jgi:hypothetical protein
MKKHMDRLIDHQHRREMEMADLRETISKWKPAQQKETKPGEEESTEAGQNCASALQEANLKHAGNLAEADRKRKKDLAETERYFHQSLRTILDRLKEKQTRRIESLGPSLPGQKREPLT